MANYQLTAEISPAVFIEVAADAKRSAQSVEELSSNLLILSPHILVARTSTGGIAAVLGMCDKKPRLLFLKPDPDEELRALMAKHALILAGVEVRELTEQ
jgi:hypothetical protein